MSFSDGFMKKGGEPLYDYVANSYFQNIILYIINSKQRKSVNLRDWLFDEMQIHTSEMTEVLNKISDKDNYDAQVIECLSWVKKNILYVGDSTSWEMTEYWQTPQETILRRTGDCEDGAILLYNLCRLKGVPANRFLILTGDVLGGGHCWLGYKPQNYPLNFAFLDWCYWPNLGSVSGRNKFYINKNSEILEYNGITEEGVTSNYYKIWFGFNESTNIINFKYNINKG